MIINSFKILFINSYKNIASLFNSTFNLSLQSDTNAHHNKSLHNAVEYKDKLISPNNTNIAQYDFSHKDYINFHNNFLNNTFFLNEKNKPILEKIHEDLSFVYQIFDVFKDQLLQKFAPFIR